MEPSKFLITLRYFVLEKQLGQFEKKRLKLDNYKLNKYIITLLILKYKSHYI